MILALKKQGVLAMNKSQASLVFDAAVKLYVSDPLSDPSPSPPAQTVEPAHASVADTSDAQRDSVKQSDSVALAADERCTEVLEEERKEERISLAQLKSLAQVNAESFLDGIADGIYSARTFRWVQQRPLWHRTPTLDAAVPHPHMPHEAANTAEDDQAQHAAINAELHNVATQLGLSPDLFWHTDTGCWSQPVSDNALRPASASPPACDLSGVANVAACDVAVCDVALHGGRSFVRVTCDVKSSAGTRIESVVLREPLVLQLVGWEWDPRRLELVCEDGQDDHDPHEGNTVVWDRFDDECANYGLARYAEIMQEATLIEPDAGEYDDSDSDDSDDEINHTQPTVVREEQVQTEAFALIKSGHASSLPQGLVLAEKRVLKASFESVDTDASGRVDFKELLNAFRAMGLAATEADVARIMSSVDEGGKLAALVLQVEKLRHIQVQLQAGGLGLKESQKADLERMEGKMLDMRQHLDIDENGAFGFEAYCRMVKFNDCQPSTHQLPRMVPMKQAILRQGGSKVLLQNANSHSWLDSYSQQPQLLERVREISRLGSRDMALLNCILPCNSCEKRSIGALWVLGEQPIQPVPHHVKGHALLVYDVDALPHVGAVTKVLDGVGMQWADERQATHFQQLVKGCSLVVAIMAGGFQYCPQCRSEFMIARYNISKVSPLYSLLQGGEDS